MYLSVALVRSLHEKKNATSSSTIVSCFFNIIFTFLSLVGATERPSEECSAQPGCPLMCRCTDGIVDCRDKSLARIPPYLPDTATEL